MLYRSVPEAARSFDLRRLQSASRAIPADAQRQHLPAAPDRFRDSDFAFPVSHLGAGSICLRAGAGGDVARRRPEKIRALRFAADCAADVAGRRATLGRLLILLLLGNIIYVGLVTIAQKRLDWMLGYSSVMHMGYIFLGIASGNLLGTNGAAILMFAHGLSIALLFAIAGEVRPAHRNAGASKISAVSAK